MASSATERFVRLKPLPFDGSGVSKLCLETIKKILIGSKLYIEVKTPQLLNFIFLYQHSTPVLLHVARVE